MLHVELEVLSGPLSFCCPKVNRIEPPGSLFGERIWGILSRTLPNNIYIVGRGLRLAALFRAQVSCNAPMPSGSERTVVNAVTVGAWCSWSGTNAVDRMLLAGVLPVSDSSASQHVQVHFLLIISNVVASVLREGIPWGYNVDDTRPCWAANCARVRVMATK